MFEVHITTHEEMEKIRNVQYAFYNLAQELWMTRNHRKEQNARLTYMPTVHYAYRPCVATVAAMDHIRADISRIKTMKKRVIEKELTCGMDELGVLIGSEIHQTQWLGSQLDVQEARARAVYSTATSLQVSSGVLAAIIWAIRNPLRGVLEPEQLDFMSILNIAGPYWEPVVFRTTDWRPSPPTNIFTTTTTTTTTTDSNRHDDGGGGGWSLQNTMIISSSSLLDEI